MGLQQHETLLIVTDSQTPHPITRSFFDAGCTLGDETLLACMQPRSTHGAEPPESIAAAMKQADVVLAPTTKSLTHTRARRQACEAGARIATMPGLSVEMMHSGGLLADYQEIRRRSEALLAQLEGAAEIHVTSPHGTDITFDVSKRDWKADTGIAKERGDYTNLPAGEVFIAPLSAEGIFVVDASMGGLGVLEEPLEFTVKKGYVTHIKGRGAEQLTSLLDSSGSKAYNVAELGIGLNPCARIIGVVLEDEKVEGSVHIALGNNAFFGGDVDVGVHLDGVMRNCTVYADGTPISLQGQTPS